MMRVVTFGEAMIRFSPPVGVSLERAEALTVDIAGTEANVAVALARLGEEAAWVSCVPDNPLGRRTVNKLREHGVDVTHVTFVLDGRMGLYFVELAPEPRAGQVVYDRAGSVFSAMPADGFPLESLQGADLLHLTGITLQLGEGPRAAAIVALDAAEAAGIPISFDLNYRRKLGPPEEAREFCDLVGKKASLLFVNRRDASAVLGLEGATEEQLWALKERYPGAVCVMTDGASGAWAFDRSPVSRSAVPGTELDRVGRGDAFCAGFLWGYRQEGIEFGLRCGVTLAALKQTYAGDFSWSTREELMTCMGEQRGLDR